MVEVPPEVTGDVLNAAVAPLGRPDVDSVTGSALPEVTAVVTVAEAGWPGVTVAVAGLSESEKSLGVLPLRACCRAVARTVVPVMSRAGSLLCQERTSSTYMLPCPSNALKVSWPLAGQGVMPVS